MAATRTDARSEASRIAQFIGLPKWQLMDDLGLVALINKGFPVATATTVVKRVDPHGRFLHPTDIIPKSTLHRREKENKHLTKDESEKIFALSKVFSEVIATYHGDLAKAGQFLLSKHPMLGGRTPMDLAKESKAGADLVLKIVSMANAGVAA